MKRADHHLVQRVLDGDVSREEFDAFQERLRRDPEIARLYQEYSHINHALYEEFEGGFAELGPVGSSRWSFGSVLAIVGIAVMLAMAAAFLWLRPWTHGGDEDEVAVLTFSVDAVWQIEGASRLIGGATGVTKGCLLSLKQGRAGLSLEPSVTAMIEGPAELRFDSTGKLEFTRGRASFQRGASGRALNISTPRINIADNGANYGLEVLPDGPDEVHVARGSVKVASITTGELADLSAGDAIRVEASGNFESIPSRWTSFAESLGRFQTVFSGPFAPADWRVEFGNPSIAAERIEGANFTAYHRLSQPQPSNDDSILLVTIKVGTPSSGGFHTDGWAGMSFYQKGREVLFFGDSYGTHSTWSLDVKQHIPIIVPTQPVLGPREVTLRYDIRSGSVSLHEGAVPLTTPFCEGKLAPGVRFDEIRIGASSGAALLVHSLQIRAGG